MLTNNIFLSTLENITAKGYVFIIKIYVQRKTMCQMYFDKTAACYKETYFWHMDT